MTEPPKPLPSPLDGSRAIGAAPIRVHSRPFAVKLLLLLAATTLFAAAPPPPPARTIEYAGPATNTTAEATATIHLTLVIKGESVTAQLKTDAPLSGSGTLTGRCIGGWCELAGKLTEGFTIKLRGVMNARDFRGLYVADLPGQPLQYGNFLVTPVPAAVPAPAPSPAPKKT